jgi:hypothetical protein
MRVFVLAADILPGTIRAFLFSGEAQMSVMLAL